jgi:ribosomal protein S18 acetylase RimI-like enzyme
MNLKFRYAKREDLPEIVRMLADDFLGATRERYETPLPESYIKAFAEIEADKNNELIVAILSEPPAVAGGLTRAAQNSKINSNVSNANLQPSATADGSDKDGEIVGTLQITFTPSISFQGGKRATIESVRVDEKYRGQGIGKELMLWAIERAKKENCFAVQLTTNAERTDAHRFYENLGFKGSHLGMKLDLKK